MKLVTKVAALIGTSLSLSVAMLSAPALAATAGTSGCKAPVVNSYMTINTKQATETDNAKIVTPSSCHGAVEAFPLCEFAPTGSTFIGPFGNAVYSAGQVSKSTCQPGWIVKELGYRWMDNGHWVYV